MTDQDYIEIRTKDGSIALLRKDQIAGIEQVGKTSRTEGYTKIYVAGYHFTLSESFSDFLKRLEVDYSGESNGTDT